MTTECAKGILKGKKKTVMKKIEDSYRPIIVAGLLLISGFAKSAVACGTPTCPPCHYWSAYYQRCVYRCDECYQKCEGNSCVPKCDPNDCERIELCSCVSRCDPDLCHVCDGEGNCLVCGGDPDQFCCNGGCCSTNNCEYCDFDLGSCEDRCALYHNCLECDGSGGCPSTCDPDETCCNDTCCDIGYCCNNEICCGSGEHCCTDSGSYCCPDSKTCCGGNCCDPETETCCNGTCCDIGNCCNDEICCGAGERCCTDSGSYCCPDSKTCCGGNCCDPETEYCCNGECCPNDKCCVDGECIQGGCMPSFDLEESGECWCYAFECGGSITQTFVWYCQEYDGGCPAGTECVQTGTHSCYTSKTAYCIDDCLTSGSECALSEWEFAPKAPRVLCGCCN